MLFLADSNAVYTIGYLNNSRASCFILFLVVIR